MLRRLQLCRATVPGDSASAVSHHHENISRMHKMWKKCQAAGRNVVCDCVAGIEQASFSPSPSVTVLASLASAWAHSPAGGAGAGDEPSLPSRCCEDEDLLPLEPAEDHETYKSYAVRGCSDSVPGEDVAGIEGREASGEVAGGAWGKIMGAVPTEPGGKLPWQRPLKIVGDLE